MKDINEYFDCEHEWIYSETTPIIQGFLQKNRYCKKCKFSESNFGFTEEEIMQKFKKEDTK